VGQTQTNETEMALNTISMDVDEQDRQTVATEPGVDTSRQLNSVTDAIETIEERIKTNETTENKDVSRGAWHTDEQKRTDEQEQKLLEQMSHHILEQKEEVELRREANQDEGEEEEGEIRERKSARKTDRKRQWKAPTFRGRFEALEIGDVVISYDIGQRDFGLCRLTYKGINEIDLLPDVDVNLMQVIDFGSDLRVRSTVDQFVQYIRENPICYMNARYVIIESQPPLNSRMFALSSAVYATLKCLLPENSGTRVEFQSASQKFSIFRKLGWSFPYDPRKEKGRYNKVKARKSNSVWLTETLLSGNDEDLKHLRGVRKSHLDDLCDAFNMGFTHITLCTPSKYNMSRRTK